MTHFINQLIQTGHVVYQYVDSVPASTWYAVAVFIGSSAAVSGLVELVKRRYFTVHNEQLAKHAVATLLGFSAFALSALQGFILYGTTNPNFLGDRTLEIVGFATLLYHFGLSNGYKKVAATLTTWVSNGKAYNAQVAASTPVEPTAPVEDANSIL